MSTLSERFHKVMQEVHLEWDSNNDSRVGKLLCALAGALPRYRRDVDQLLTDLTVADGLPALLDAAVEDYNRERARVMALTTWAEDVVAFLKTIEWADHTSEDASTDLCGRLFDLQVGEGHDLSRVQQRAEGRHDGVPAERDGSARDLGVQGAQPDADRPGGAADRGDAGSEGACALDPPVVNLMDALARGLQARFHPKRACEGAATIDDGMMQECPHAQCGLRVTNSLVDHPCFGFRAACPMKGKA